MKFLHHLLLLSILFLTPSLRAQSSYNDSLNRIINQGQNETEINRAKLLLAESLMPKFIDSASVLITEAQVVLGQNDKLNKALYYNVKGVREWFSNRYDSATLCFRNTLSLENDPEIKPKKAQAANNIGALLNMQGANDSAKKYLEYSLQIDEELGNQRGITKTYYDLGVLHSRLDMYEISMGYYLKVLDYQTAKHDTLRLIHTLNALGIVQSKLSNSSNPIQYYLQAIALDKQYKGIDLLGNTYNNIAGFYNSHNQYDSTIYYGLLGLENSANGPASQLVTLYTNIGTAYSNLKQYPLAFDYLRKAKALLPEVKLPIVRTALLLTLGGAHSATGSLDSAEYYITQAMELARTVNSLSWLKNSHFAMAKNDSLRGNFKQALANFQIASKFQDSILNQGNLSRISELEVIYKTDKKDTENRVLRKQNELNNKIISIQNWLIMLSFAAILFFILFLVTQYRSNKKLLRKNKEIMEQKAEIDLQNIKLTELNQTKDKFFSIISHDLRGPFNALMSLLNIIVDDYASLTEEEKLSILKSIRKNSENTFNLLINLLDWSRAQRGLIQNNPEMFNLSILVDEVFEILSSRASQKGHELHNEIPEDTSLYTDRHLMSSILINLINNSIKFTPSKGTIRVSSRKSDDRLTICVSDNGIGIPGNKLDYLFRLDSDINRPGTENELGTGLGLILVKEFVELIGGTITVSSNYTNQELTQGSVFCITVPIKSELH